MAYSLVNLDRTGPIDDTVYITGLQSILQKQKNAYVRCNIRTSVDPTNLPDGYDLYILGWWHEVFDDQWFLNNYNKHAQFIILGDFLPNSLKAFENVTFIRLLHWRYFTTNIIPPKIDWNLRTIKISSLSYYINTYRFFITASLLQKENTLVSWHNKQRVHTNSVYNVNPTGRESIDKLMVQKDQLCLPRVLDHFIPDPVDDYHNSIHLPAYRNTLVNCINESTDVSWTQRFGTLPGPYITEKTWKSLLNGVAIIFSGQYNIRRVLEQAGFVFDYPWSNDYADVPGDLDRLEKILHLLDTICEMTVDEIKIGVKESCEYNQAHMFSSAFNSYVNETNSRGLSELEKALQ